MTRVGRDLAATTAVAVEEEEEGLGKS